MIDSNLVYVKVHEDSSSSRLSTARPVPTASHRVCIASPSYSNDKVENRSTFPYFPFHQQKQILPVACPLSQKGRKTESEVANGGVMEGET